MGYFGFAAGPAKHIIDPVGLCDALLARLPARPGTPWTTGHFWRPLPAGYLESLESGLNLIEDPDLKQYYEHVRLITRGPLLDPERLLAILEMNLGRYDHLIRGYIGSRDGS